MTAFDSFSKRIADSIKNEEQRQAVFNTLFSAKTYKYTQYPCDMYLDIYSMAEAYSKASDRKISEAAELLKESVRETVLSEQSDSGYGIGVHFIPLISAQLTAVSHSVDYIKNPNAINQSAFIRENNWWVPTISGNSGSLLDKLFYTAY